MQVFTCRDEAGKRAPSLVARHEAKVAEKETEKLFARLAMGGGAEVGNNKAKRTVDQMARDRAFRNLPSNRKQLQCR